jgi:ABC-type sugar transport system ATPase subunit
MAMGGQKICIEGLKKIYQGNIVVDIDELELEIGHSYGLMGTNGSGKTTLMKLLAGYMKEDAGKIDKQGLRVEMVQHEVGLFQEQTLYENMFLNREASKRIGPFKWIDWKTTKQWSRLLLEKYQFDIDIEVKTKSLGLSTQKIIEIMIALSKDPDVLIIDEPLTLLDLEQVKEVNSLLKAFVEQGNKMLIYISHRMDELFMLADEVITLRNGRIYQKRLMSPEEALKLWEFSETDIRKYPKRQVTLGKELLRVSQLTTNHLSGISFDLKEGEILGIIGLKGSHKSDIGRALFGALTMEGQLRIHGKPLKLKSTAQAVSEGICYMGSTQEGIFLEDSILENVVSANTKRARRLSLSAKKLISKYYLEKLNINTNELSQSAHTMSAGNKQKVLLAKWFFSSSKVFIFNKPTANIDIPSKVDIYNVFADLAESRAGLIIISNDLEEVAGLCDRVLVIKEGCLDCILDRKMLSVHHLVSILQNW